MYHGNRDDGFDPDFCLVGESVINVTYKINKNCK